MAFLEREHFTVPLAESDGKLDDAIRGEVRRQEEQIELIASENFVSAATLNAIGTILTNKTLEGYPGSRYYGGASFADRVERLAIDRAQRLFHCRYANVQPHSGSHANQAVYLALINFGDRILSMSVEAGGHISHGHPATLTGRLYEIFSYDVRQEDERIDYEDVADRARKYRPKLIVAGGTAYPRIIDWVRLRAIADEVQAWLMVDMAHFAGLVATQHYPSPLEHAHVVTTTTYKSLRGARGGMILSNAPELAKKLDSAVFPGIQGSIHLHSIAGKAACLGEALQPQFTTYSQNVLDNAQRLAQSLEQQSLRLVSGGTDTGLLLVDVRPKGISGQEASQRLEKAGIVCNKNLIPHDPTDAETSSGIRLSTNAGTTRGFSPEEFWQIGQWIGQILDVSAHESSDSITSRRVSEQVRELCRRFPLYRSTD